MDPLIRPMCVEDIEFALAQTARERWGIADGGFQMHLRHDPNGCFIAEFGSRSVGMITTTQYGRSACVGNLIVDPEYRRQGIGRILMSHAMQRLRDAGVAAVHLEADAPGVPLYRELGFVDVFESLRFRCKEPLRDGSGYGCEVRPLVAEHLPAVGELDRHRFGDDRTRLLTSLLEMSPAAFIAGSGGDLAGYVITQMLPVGARIGPWVADNAEAAAALLDAVLENLDAARFELGLPEVNGAGVTLLESRGFTFGASCLRMVRGDRRYDGEPERIFGIAGGDRG